MALDVQLEQAGSWPEYVMGEWTVDMLETLPDDGRRYEIIDGTLLVSRSATTLHQRVLGELMMLFHDACPDDQRVYPGPLDWQPDNRTSLQPDLLVVRKDRIGERNITEPLTVVVEVATPATARIDLTAKFSRYQDGGVAQYWLANPAEPSVQVFDLIDGSYILQVEGAGEDAVTVTGPLNVTVVPRRLVER